MGEIQNHKRYDLEERSLDFSKKLIGLIKKLPKDTINMKLSGQLIRSGTSMGANYREANETETKKDFCYRIRICRKEGKETLYWLQLVEEANPNLTEEIKTLYQETSELVKIFASILEKSR